MRVYLDKHFLLTAFCCSRQAERSVDRVIVDSEKWAQLREYYDSNKRRILTALVGRFRELGLPQPPPSLHREHFANRAPGGLLGCVPRLLNRLKSRWGFSADELSFISSTLRRFVRTLEDTVTPGPSSAVDLRMDLYACEWIIETRIMGAPGLREAGKIEYFNQSRRLKTVSLDQVLAGACRTSAGG